MTTALSPDDCQIVPNARGGYDLYIRKKPRIDSVLLTDVGITGSGNVDRYVYRAWEWNSVNGNEQYAGLTAEAETLAPWVLIDSTPEPYVGFGEAFHIYIPPVIYLFNAGKSNPWTEVPLRGGLKVNIRSCSLSNGNFNGRYSDNEFFIEASGQDNSAQKNLNVVRGNPQGASTRNSTEAAQGKIVATARASANPYNDNELVLEVELSVPDTAGQSSTRSADRAPDGRSSANADPASDAPANPRTAPANPRTVPAGPIEDFTVGERVAGALLNPLLGLGSYIMGDPGAGVIITLGYGAALGLILWEYLGYDQDRRGLFIGDTNITTIPGIAGISAAVATTVFGILRPILYHKPGSPKGKKAAAVLDRARVAVIPDAAGIKAVRLSYNVQF